MTKSELIEQLKRIYNIHPDQQFSSVREVLSASNRYLGLTSAEMALGQTLERCADFIDSMEEKAIANESTS